MHLSLVFVCALVGCGTQPAATSDDAGSPVPYTADDFESFGWSFLGTGLGRGFSLDRDCGVTSSKFPPRADGTGVVAAGDCDGFKALVVSPEVLAALRGSVTCPFITDDVESMVLTTTDDAAVARSTTGCSSVAPLTKIYAAMDDLTGKYVVFVVADSGVDTKETDAPDGD